MPKRGYHEKWEQVSASRLCLRTHFDVVSVPEIKTRKKPANAFARLPRAIYHLKIGMKALQHTIKAIIRPGEESGYVADCVEIAVVTQGATLDEVTRNLQEAVALHLDGEDLGSLGLAPHPTLVVTMEVAPAYA